MLSWKSPTGMSKLLLTWILLFVGVKLLVILLFLRAFWIGWNWVLIYAECQLFKLWLCELYDQTNYGLTCLKHCKTCPFMLMPFYICYSMGILKSLGKNFGTCCLLTIWSKIRRRNPKITSSKTYFSYVSIGPHKGPLRAYVISRSQGSVANPATLALCKKGPFGPLQQGYDSIQCGGVKEHEEPRNTQKRKGEQLYTVVKDGESIYDKQIHGSCANILSRWYLEKGNRASSLWCADALESRLSPVCVLGSSQRA